MVTPAPCIPTRQLHTWAAGSPGREAAVRLLTTAAGGRLADTSWPWICGDSRGAWWFDTGLVGEQNTEGLTGGEIRLLHIAASLAGDRPVVLSDALARLDPEVAPAVAGAVALVAGGVRAPAW